MAESHINIVGNETNLEMIATKATEDVSGDEANLEMTIATFEVVSGDEANLEVLAIIAKDVSKIDCVLDCLNDNQVGDDLEGNDEHNPRTKKEYK